MFLEGDGGWKDVAGDSPSSVSRPDPKDSRLISKCTPQGHRAGTATISALSVLQVSSRGKGSHGMQTQDPKSGVGGVGGEAQGQRDWKSQVETAGDRKECRTRGNKACARQLDTASGVIHRQGLGQEEMKSGAGEPQRGLQKEKLTQDSEHKGPGAGQSPGRRSGGPGRVRRRAGLHPETPRTSWAYRLPASGRRSSWGRNGRDLAQLPPFPETDWFVPTSLFSPPLPQSHVKIFSLSTEGGGGQMCWGK